jgi:hypothetical protein
MITAAVDAGMPVPWVAGDEVYVCRAGFEPKVFLSHEVSADYAGLCGDGSVISSDVHEEVLTAVSGGPSRAGPWSLPRE